MTVRRPAKADGDWVYADTGCHLYPSCLACPRPRCIFDEPLVPASRRPKPARNAEILRLAGEGKSRQAIAALVGVSKRTVDRIRADARDAPSP